MLGVLCDEVLEDPLGHLEAVGGLEVLGPHGARDVEGEHHVDAVALLLEPAPGALGPAQGDDHQRERGEAQGGQHDRQALLGALLGVGQEPEGREGDARRALAAQEGDRKRNEQSGKQPDRL
ncbi:hypothetical protein D3C86_1276370 [compost metagenome]